MSGFRLRQPHLHPLYRREIGEECKPGELVSLDDQGRIVRATGTRPVVGVCWEAPPLINECGIPSQYEPDPKEGPRTAWYRDAGAGEFIVDKPKSERDKGKRIEVHRPFAKLVPDGDGVEPANTAGDADLRMVEDLGDMMVVLVRDRRRLL